MFHINSYPKWIIISVDGLAARFVTQENMPYLKSLELNGTFSNNMKPIFPSKTFPNHQSISTGLYAESHGIVNNKFKTYDGEEKQFKKDSKEEFWWNYNGNIRPIYIANEESGWGRKSATVFWPGSAVTYNKRQITKFESEYKKDVLGQKRLEMGKDYIVSNTYNLVMIYLEDLDVVAHEKGPAAQEVKDVLKNIDDWLQSVVTFLLTDQRNTVIILSDHGFSELNTKKHIPFSQIIDADQVDVIADEAILLMNPAGCGNCSELEKRSRTIISQINSRESVRYQAYYKTEIPKKYHYKNNPRIPAILVVFNYGFYTVVKGEPRKGSHGWPADDDPQMLAYFLGIGNKFKANNNAGEINNVDLYKVFCDVLDINKSCNPSNYTEANVQRILKK